MCTVLIEILTLVSERIQLLLVINKLRPGNQSVLCEGHGSDYTLATRHILFPPHFQAYLMMFLQSDLDTATPSLFICVSQTLLSTSLLGEHVGSASCLRTQSHGFTHIATATYSHTILVWLRLQTDNNRQSDTKRCVKTIRYYCKMQHLRQGTVTGALLWRRWWLQPYLLYLCISSAQTMAFSFMSICSSAIVCVCVAGGWICQTCSHMGRYRQNKKNNNVGKSTCCSISWIKPLTWHQHIN